MNKIDTNKTYLIEKKWVLHKKGIFRKKEDIYRHTYTAEFYYDRGNANPPTSVGFTGMNSQGGVLNFGIDELKIGFWFKYYDTGYEVKISEL